MAPFRVPSRGCERRGERGPSTAVLRRPVRRRRPRAARGSQVAHSGGGRRALRALVRAVARAGARGRSAGRPPAGRRRRRGLRQDRDHGRPGLLARGQPRGRTGGDPRADLHAQGGQRAQRADPAAARRPGAAPRDRARPAGTAGDRPAHRLDLPRVRGRAGRRARAADRRRARGRGARPGHVLGAGGDRRGGLHRRHERRPADAAHHRRGRPRAGRRPRRARHQPCCAAGLDGAAGLADRRLRRRPAQEGAVRPGPRDARPAEGAGRTAAAGRGVRGAQARGGQLRMLEALFGHETGHPVLAVGDPRQSIYGWRGASAGTIERFDRTFPGLAGRRAERLTLATSWRNDDAVLAVANAVSGTLPPPDQPLPDLAPAPTAGRGAVTVGLYDTVADETEALADRLAACWLNEDPLVAHQDGKRPTVAVLVRARKQLPGIAAALRERGLPVEVVGLGGLLEVPEVSDVIATLTVLVDPTAGDALGRLLTGARWRLGPRDLAALETRSRTLVRERGTHVPADGAT